MKANGSKILVNAYRHTGQSVTDKVWCESWKDKKWETTPYSCEMTWSPLTQKWFCSCSKAPLTGVTCLPSPDYCKDC